MTKPNMPLTDAQRQRKNERKHVWRQNHPEYKEYERRYWQTHSDYAERQRKQMREHHRENREAIRQKSRAYYHAHRDESLAISRRYRESHKSHLGEYRMLYNAKIKKEVIAHYSNGTMQCARCAFSDIRALQLDHIKGDGKEDRKDSHKRGNAFYVWLRRNNYPEGLQVLCVNCNMIKKSENNESAKSFPQRVIPDVPTKESTK